MVDEGGKSGGEVVRRDVGSGEVVRVVGWDMSGGEGGDGSESRSVSQEGIVEVSRMG